MAPVWGYPPSPKRKFWRPRRRWLRSGGKLPGWTGNALVTALIAAIVSGGISFAVAHYQVQDAGRQAVAGQQVQTATQLETDANGLYEATFTLWGRCSKNLNLCPNAAITDTIYVADNAAFNAERMNVSDSRLYALAANLEYFVAQMLSYVGTDLEGGFVDQTANTYQQLIARCGQIIQGQS